MRQQLRQLVTGLFSAQVAEDDLQIAAELPENLPAGAARRSRLRSVRDDGDAREGPMPLGNRFEHRHTLGTDCEAIGGVLDVAARHDLSVRRFEGGPDAEVREGRVSMLAS